ncbi:MAG: hypothetical protein U9Q77_03360 [Candidatus Marinimicrobia bacterium]|nr:hypothetical protein [Candidatus Neomarinimicrobiota bacterium]
MKSFRVERQRQNASSQLIGTLLVLLATIVLVRFLPTDVKKEIPQTTKTSWETSVIKLP